MQAPAVSPTVVVFQVRIVSISTSRRSLHITLDLSSPIPDHASLAGSLRGGGTGKNLLKPGDLIARDSLRLLVATDQGLFVSVEVAKGAIGASKHGEVKQTRGKMSMRASAGDGEADHKEVTLGFVPKLHLSDEVRLAEELFDLLEVRTGWAGNALCADPSLRGPSFLNKLRD